MDKDGILGILTSLNNFLNNGNVKSTDNNNNNQPDSEVKSPNARDENKPTEPDLNINIPPQMAYSNQILEVISRHEQHLKKVKQQQNNPTVNRPKK